MPLADDVEPAAPAGEDGRRVPRIWDAAVVVALLLGVVAIYAQVRGFEFVNYDDQDYVFENPMVRGGLSWRAVGWALTTGHAANWHPLTWLSHLADVSMFGLWPGGHHLTAVAFHAANAVLLFVLLRVMTHRFWPCAFAAALFAWHPLRAESVAWVSERKDVLSLFFGLLSLIAYARHARRDQAGGWYAASLVALALSLLSKGMFVTMPFVMLLLDVWPLRRVDLFDRSTRSRRALTLVLEKLPAFGLVLAISVTTYTVQRRAGAVMTETAVGALPRALNAVVSVVRYVRMTAAPYGLCSYYPHPYVDAVPDEFGIRAPVALGASAIVVVATLVALLAFRRRPYLTIGWLWFCGTLIPVIGLIQVGNQALADRYTYVPGIGLAIAAAWLLADVASRGRAARAAVVAVGSLALVGYGVIAYRQVGTWRDSLSLMRRGLEIAPHSAVAHNSLAVIYDHAGDLAAAEREYRAALALRPDYTTAAANLASVLIKTGRLDAAGELITSTLQGDPYFAPAHAVRADWELARGDREAAFREYERAIALRPREKRTYHNYALSLAQAGRIEEAKRRWREALDIDPDYVMALDGYGRALLITGETAEAYAVLRRTIALSPNDDSACYALAWAMATHPDPRFRDPASAARYATRAAELTPSDPTGPDALAAALAAGGRFAEAAATADRAAALAAREGDATLAAAIRDRASLYRAGKAYVSGTQKR